MRQAARGRARDRAARQSGARGVRRVPPSLFARCEPITAHRCATWSTCVVVAYAIYRLLLLLRGTRAMQVAVGLALVGVVYLVAQRLGLVTTYTLLDRFLASFLCSWW